MRPDVDLDLPETVLLLRRVLERHRPLGILGGDTQLFPLGEAVHLYHSAIDVIGQLAPESADLFDLSRSSRFDIIGDKVFRRYPEAQRSQVLQRLGMGGDLACPRSAAG